MRAYDNGSFYSVSVSAREVGAFKSTWPCSGLPERSLWFQFSKNNHDLVDLAGNGDYDGDDLLALSQDAQRYARQRLNLGRE